MTRNKVFSTAARNPSVSPCLKHHYTSGPLSWLNPTRAHYHFRNRDDHSDDQETPRHQSAPNDLKIGRESQLTANVTFLWRSRDNRKGRHAIIVHPSSPDDPNSGHNLTPPLTSTFRQTLAGIKRMFLLYPYWDISWLVAVIFTIGSVVWVINAFFVFLPLVRPSSEFNGEEKVAGGWTAWLGATIFEVGSWLLLSEAVNENREACFGWAVEKALEGEGGAREEVKMDEGGCKHRHRRGWRKQRIRGGSEKLAGSADPTSTDTMSSSPPPSNDQPSSRHDGKSWIWFPTLSSLREHYFRELGFLASLIQLMGASIFWISGFTAIPKVVPEEKTNLLLGVYWAPQVVGGSGFIISSFLYMLETQKYWWKPEPKILGWHIGFWNFIGGVGFMLSGAFGIPNTSWGKYQSACSTFWGSFAFLIGSLVQWYESLSKFPVEVGEAEGEKQI